MNDPYYSGRRNYGSFILNFLTLVLVLATIGVLAVVGVVFVNPYVPFNPYPPPTLPPTLGPPTATPTPEIFLPESWTATPSRTPLPSETPTETPTPPPTAVLTDTPGPTPTGPPFALQPGVPVLTPNIANDLGCEWMGVGGQVFDRTGEPIVGDLGIHLEGQIGGLPIELDTLTGTEPNLGPGGYVFNVSDHPIASENTLSIQLVDSAGVALSDEVFLTTSDSCNENFVLVNWRQVR